jgi:hypothetical protein
MAELWNHALREAGDVKRIRDLNDTGVGPAEIQRLRRTSSQLTWGFYTERGLDQRERYTLKCQAVLQRLQPAAALAGPSAALAWELPIPGPPPEPVFVRNIPRGTYAHDVRVLPEGPTELVGDLQVTSPIMTVVDCARLLSSRDALIVADAALAGGLCTVDDLHHAAQALVGRPGASRMRWVAANADPLSESPGETWTRTLVHQLGYDTTSQAYVTDGQREAWLDLLLSDGRTAIEFDGLIKYKKKGLAKVVQQHLRDGDLQAIGYHLLHVIWGQLSDPRKLNKRLLFAGAVPSRRPLLLDW